MSIERKEYYFTSKWKNNFKRLFVCSAIWTILKGYSGSYMLFWFLDNLLRLLIPLEVINVDNISQICCTFQLGTSQIIIQGASSACIFPHYWRVYSLVLWKVLKLGRSHLHDRWPSSEINNVDVTTSSFLYKRSR